MTTHPSPYTSKYLDGWADACHQLRRELATEDCCPGCAVDRVRFAGIAAAAIAEPDGYPARDDLVTAAAETIMGTATQPDPRHRAALIGEARTLVSAEPAIAADVLTQLALILARYYADDAAALAVAPSEWG